MITKDQEIVKDGATLYGHQMALKPESHNTVFLRYEQTATLIKLRKKMVCSKYFFLSFIRGKIIRENCIILTQESEIHPHTDDKLDYSKCMCITKNDLLTCTFC